MNRHEFLKTLAGGATSLLVARRAPGDEPSEPRTFTYKSAGGCDLKLDVYCSDPNVRKPVIAYLHGGALITGSRKDAPKWLTQQGDHVLISIDYRLAPVTKLPAILEDVQDAFRWVYQQGPRILNIDAGKLMVAGESAGGYLTLMTGFCLKPRPKALLSISGYGDIAGAWYSRPSADFLKQPRISKEEAYGAIESTCVTGRAHGHSKLYPYCRQNGLWPQVVTGHDPDAEPRWFDRYSPLRNVSAKYPPTVLVHGTADTDVPYEESDAMDKALTRFRVPHKFISVSGGGHVLSGIDANEKARVHEEALVLVKDYAGWGKGK